MVYGSTAYSDLVGYNFLYLELTFVDFTPSLQVGSEIWNNLTIEDPTRFQGSAQFSTNSIATYTCISSQVINLDYVRFCELRHF